MAEMKERLAKSGNNSSSATPVGSGSQVELVSKQSDITDGIATGRKKKRRHEVYVECDVDIVCDAEGESVMEDVVPVKDSKKKRRHRIKEELERTNEEEEVEEEQKKKRKKNKKQKKDSCKPLSNSVHCDNVSSTVDVDSHADPPCCIRDSCDV